MLREAHKDLDGPADGVGLLAALLEDQSVETDPFELVGGDHALRCAQSLYGLESALDPQLLCVPRLEPLAGDEDCRVALDGGVPHRPA